MMKHSDGYVLKPVPHPIYGPREINFYKTLETTCDPLLKDLKQYIPQYLGTTTIELDNKGKTKLEIICDYDLTCTQVLNTVCWPDVRCICMEDITKDFKLPCVMDVKIGVQTWEPDASEEKIKMERVSNTFKFSNAVKISSFVDISHAYYASIFSFFVYYLAYFSHNSMYILNGLYERYFQYSFIIASHFKGKYFHLCLKVHYLKCHYSSRNYFRTNCLSHSKSNNYMKLPSYT